MEREGMTTYVAVEEGVRAALQWLRLVVEVIGAGVIAVGIALALFIFIRASLHAHRNAFTDARLTLARYLSVALEFQLAADVLSTAIAPSWDQLGKLAAIVVIRTTLNYFLMREVEHGEADAREGGGSAAPPEDPAAPRGLEGAVAGGRPG